jgi:predicted site-specific integrase-resolvase
MGRKKLVGYARVSTTGQDLTRQLRALKADGCDPIYRDKASGKSLEGRPELAKAIDRLGPVISSCSPNGTAAPARCGTVCRS